MASIDPFNKSYTHSMPSMYDEYDNCKLNTEPEKEKPRYKRIADLIIDLQTGKSIPVRKLKMKVFEDQRNGGPNSDRATSHQLHRLMELKIEHSRDITWLQAKQLIKEHHQKKKEKLKRRTFFENIRF